MVKHKSLLCTRYELYRHMQACLERLDSCMQLAKAFNIQLLLLQHSVH